ncbi:hypothetical protein LP419_06720 [Massilia sp. H-1]|nr:hypothetical protein LP419_06720 [Massilia sp. H-1]
MYSCSAAVGQTRVASFTPQGTVKQVRQATARFSAQMVPFGDLRLSDPFTIDCAEKGKGRWIDGSNWSYDFERDLRRRCAAASPCARNCATWLKQTARGRCQVRVQHGRAG